MDALGLELPFKPNYSKTPTHIMSEYTVVGEGSNATVYAYTSAIYNEIKPLVPTGTSPEPSFGYALKFGVASVVAPGAPVNTIEYNLLNRLVHPRILVSRYLLRWQTPPPEISPSGLLMPRAIGTITQVERNGMYRRFMMLYPLADVLLALAYLHQHGYVHRDLKEANVLVFPGEDLVKGGGTQLVATLADLGNVCSIHHPELLRKRMGTYVYSAPESLFTDDYGTAIDIWSLAIMIINLVADWLPQISQDYGTLPYVLTTEPTAAQLRALGLEPNGFALEHSTHWTLETELLDASLGAGTTALLTAMLDIDPAKRPTANEVLAHPVFERVQPYIRQLEAKIARLPKPVSLNRTPTSLNPKLRAVAKREWEHYPSATQNCSKHRFYYSQAVNLADRYLRLDQGAQAEDVLQAAKLLTDDYYMGTSLDLDSDAPKAVIDCCYAILKKFPRGDLMMEPDTEAVLALLA